MGGSRVGPKTRGSMGRAFVFREGEGSWGALSGVDSVGRRGRGGPYVGTRFRESGSEAARKTARGKRCPQRRRTLCVDCGLSDGRPQRLSINFNVDVRCISLRVR